VIMSPRLKQLVTEKFRCEPPCDSYGMCGNCIDAKFFRVGYRQAVADAVEIAGLYQMQYAFPERSIEVGATIVAERIKKDIKALSGEDKCIATAMD
jgi:hypothetical protein